MWNLSFLCMCTISSLIFTTCELAATDSSHNAGDATGVWNGSLWNATWTDRLKHDLLAKYDKFARPAQHTNATEVQFSLVVKHVEIDEMRSIMVLNAWTRMEWNDEKLLWNASDYDGIKRLTVADHEVWQPDVVLYNSALGNSLDHYGNTHCLVGSDGRVLWVPPSQFSVFCDLDLRKWPRDSQTCRFYFGSWVYDEEQIKLVRTSNQSADLETDMEPCGWTVTSVQQIDHVKYYVCCSEPYYNVEIEITVERRDAAAATIVFVPAAVCVALTLALFWLPPGATEKFILSGVTSIITSMFLIFFAQHLPMGSNLPYIVRFYSYTLGLVCLSVVVSVASVGLGRRPRARPLPWIIAKALSGRLASLFLLPSNEKDWSSYPGRRGQDCEELHERGLVDRGRTESMDATSTPPAAAHRNHDWALLATAVDRLFFLLYLAIFLVLSLAFYFS